MHGTGLFTALIDLSGRRLRSSRSTGRHFDVDELLDTVERERVNTIVDRRRRVRQADAASPRRRPRPVGPLERCS